MAKNDNLKDFLTDVANAIREKKGTTDLINPQDFSAEIASIETGGGDTPAPDIPVIGDGKTYLYIKIAEKGRMVVPLYFSQTVANGVTIDWGDGSATQTLDGTVNRSTTHTYADIGEYVISLNPSSGCTLGLGYNTSPYCVMGNTGNEGRVFCNMLQAVEIGKNVKSIGGYAFDSCYSLASVVIPQGVTSIGSYAFKNCYSLASVVIPQGVTSIGEYAFDSCYSLASVVIPQGVTSIGRYAFRYCTSLVSVVIPEGVTSIGSTVFSNCTSLVSVVIPEGVTSIGGYAFDSCYSLASVVIPEGVTSIGSCAFSNCYSLASVVIPEGVTSIGSYAFDGCYSLASVVIPQGVTSIGSYAFKNCYSLANLVIPEGVTSIGEYAFRYCYAMAFYDFRASKSVPTLSNSNAFNNNPSDCKIVVPDSLYDTWIAATNWSTYASKIIKASEFDA